ncbi:prolyl oligopeptidase family serine peptidase [Promicromonospora sp. NPDC050262]|uniref:alpha/beta hydrolase family protein n=1 Tax=Promicromonospora sp. NPDC050262 TaxID=3155036 RepID=UPI0034084FDC
MNIPEGGEALTVARLDRRGTTSHETYTAGFYESGWDFTTRSILGKASRGGSEPGEVLATISRVKPKDHQAWFAAWTELGRQVASIAQYCADHGHRVSSARAFLRAANYLAVAVNAIDGLDGDTSELLPTFRAHRAAWQGFVSQTHWPAEPVSIPSAGTSMPGWFFRPDETGERRPTLVMNNGSDGSVSGLWCQGAEGALERGYNVLLFDGPGQQSMLFERGVPFRPDWENVLTPVVDFLGERGEVDDGKLAVYGISQGGYWVPRALAFEHRFAAAIADGGVVDVSRSWFANIPHTVLNDYRKGDKEKFDRNMAFAMKLPGARTTRQTWTFRARPYGAYGYSAVLDAVSDYVITPEIGAAISTPLLITDPDGDQFFPQSAELNAIVPGSTLLRFKQREGASYHNQPLARELTEQRVLDWLDETLAHDG